MMKGTIWAAAAAAGLAAVSGVSAKAADLGGNCCADLEERVAELEATTARKGNRKVSLEVSGHVNQGVLWWDDGFESNVGVYTNDNARTRVRFKGKAKIDGDLEAGYLLEIGVRSANSKRFTQLNPTGGSVNPVTGVNDIGLDLRDSVWYIKSKRYGTGYVGQTATATDAITEINLTQTADFSKYSDVEDTGLGLLLRNSVTGGLSALSYRRLIGDAGDQPGEGERRFNQVKYLSPEWQGFTVSASWGEDDYWDAAVRYKGEFNGIEIAAGFGYGEISDGIQTLTVCAAISTTGPDDADCRQFGGSVSVLHQPTGLFVNFGAGQKHDNLISSTARFAGTGVDQDQTFYAVQSGIERKFNEFGKTTIYGEYYNYEGGGNTRNIAVGDAVNPFAGSAAIWDTGVEVIGAGLAQGFDKAALVLYLSYRHVEADLTVRQLVGGNANGAFAEAPLTDLDLVFAGGIIKF